MLLLPPGLPPTGCWHQLATVVRASVRWAELSLAERATHAAPGAISGRLSPEPGVPDGQLQSWPDTQYAAGPRSKVDPLASRSRPNGAPPLPPTTSTWPPTCTRASADARGPASSEALPLE